MDKIFKIVRVKYLKQTTSGDFYTPEDHCKRFCVTLEDTVRPKGIKVKKHTALPAGLYFLSVSHSSRFKRLMPIIYTETDRNTSKMGNIEFGGARLHGGNDHEDTDGCPLTAFNRINWRTIQGTSEKEITKMIQIYEEQGHKCFLKIVNNKQAK